MSPRGEAAIAFAEKVLALLELGAFSATYKYALLSALLDLCLERTSSSGAPPTTLTTRQIAEKVTELYWPHAVPYQGGGVLRQGGVRSGSQAEILSAISDFRLRHAGLSGELHARARLAHPEAFEPLLRTVEWKLIEMPIPRCQRMGREEDRFLYDYAWTETVRHRVVTAYQRGAQSAFDNRLLLRPDAAGHLVALNGVLRPVIRREWALMVGAMNHLPEAALEEFLFGASRASLEAVRRPLHDLQEGRCFYCQESTAGRSDVDHFIPWARYADDSLDNLVLAHPRCNNQKRDFFAGVGHLAHWVSRQRRHGTDLDRIAADVAWPRDSRRSLAVARAMYSRLPDGARLWVAGDEFAAVDREGVRAAFGP